VKILLDETWPPEAAVQLRGRGHDVVAVAERPELRGQPDALGFVTAQSEQRAVVTENVADYRPLAVEALARDNSHAGLVFTTNLRFPRHDPRTIGRMIPSLDRLLTSGEDLSDAEHWLP
jgi:hypothetical protein